MVYKFVDQRVVSTLLINSTIPIHATQSASCFQYNICKKKLESKRQALKILMGDLESCQRERDIYKNKIKQMVFIYHPFIYPCISPSIPSSVYPFVHSFIIVSHVVIHFIYF